MLSLWMTLRLELFVDDLDVAIAFYSRVLGFQPIRKEADYASLRNGAVILGLGPTAKLPATGGYFTQVRLQGQRGVGVEIVLEVDDVHAAYQQVLAAGASIVDPLVAQPWGLTDFRLTDPDGYYLRITSKR